MAPSRTALGPLAGLLLAVCLLTAMPAADADPWMDWDHGHGEQRSAAGAPTLATAAVVSSAQPPAAACSTACHHMRVVVWRLALQRRGACRRPLPWALIHARD